VICLRLLSLVLTLLAFLPPTLSSLAALSIFTPDALSSFVTLAALSSIVIHAPHWSYYNGRSRRSIGSWIHSRDMGVVPLPFRSSFSRDQNVRSCVSSVSLRKT
jgi:hypothetical protein